MANLDRIVNVQISLNTTAIREQSFSDLLVAGPHSLSVTRTLVVTAADQLRDMGMSEQDPVYLAVSDVFKQTPGINQVYVGRQHVDQVRVNVTKAAVADYSMTIKWRDAGGEVMSATAAHSETDPNASPAEIAEFLADAIGALSAPVIAQASGAEISISHAVQGSVIAVSVKGNLAVQTGVSTETFSTALAACKAETNGWYGIVITSREEADILSAADWTEANEKLLGVCSGQAGIIDPGIDTDIASKLQEKQMFRTTVWYHAKAATEWLEAAVMGNRFTFYPGAETWANTRLSGISHDNLPEGGYLVAASKNANTFEPFRNFAITQNGRVAAGEWVDVIRFRDWLSEQMKIAVVSALINIRGNLGKVPYADGGIQAIGNVMSDVLRLGVARGGIAPQELDADGKVVPSFVVTLPLSADVAFNDKANRVLRDVSFTARLAGAIHAVEIKGNLTYEL